MITNMTEGSPSKILWKFTIPMLLSVVFQQLYNIVDSIIAGKYIGEQALAAVGGSYPVTMIFMAVATGSNIGCSVVVSQLFGANEKKDMKTAISTSIISVISISVLLTVLGLTFCDSIITLLNTPQEIFVDSSEYLRVYICGLFFLFLYNICTGVFTALGDSKTPLIFLIISSVGNIVLDLVFVINFGLGVAGVAWATFIAQGVSSILAFIVLFFRLRKIKINEKHSYFCFDMLKRISKIAIPSILQQSFISVGNLLIQGLINSYGCVVMAGYSAAIKLNTFAITSFSTLANGISSFTAQNIGAAKFDRIKKGFRSGLFMAASVALVFVCAFTFFSSDMISIFLNKKDLNHDVIKVGTDFLRIVSPFYLVIILKLIADGVLRGAGAMKAFMIATFSDLIIRVVLSFVFAKMFGSTGIWWSWPVGWVIATVMSYMFYKKDVWKNKTI